MHLLHYFVFHYLSAHLFSSTSTWRRQQTCFTIWSSTITKKRRPVKTVGTQWQPDDALHETVYQTQLLTMAFLNGHYRTPALVIETINNFQRRAVVQLAIQNLKDLYPLVVKENLEQIFIWLSYKHAPILRHTGQPLDFIVQRLNIPPDAGDIVNSPEGEAQ